MLEISQVELCARASVGRNLLNDFETGARVPRASNLARIRAVLEDAGARFVDFDDGTIGVRVVPPAAGSASG